MSGLAIVWLWTVILQPAVLPRRLSTSCDVGLPSDLALQAVLLQLMDCDVTTRSGSDCPGLGAAGCVAELILLPSATSLSSSPPSRITPIPPPSPPLKRRRTHLERMPGVGQGTAGDGAQLDRSCVWE